VLVSKQTGMEYLKASALIGLGFQGLQQQEMPLFVDNLYNNKIIDDKIF